MQTITMNKCRKNKGGLFLFQTPTPVPNADPRIEGIFMPRDEIISIIDLAECLHLPKPETPTGDMYIVTNFNKLNTGISCKWCFGNTQSVMVRYS